MDFHIRFYICTCSITPEFVSMASV